MYQGDFERQETQSSSGRLGFTHADLIGGSLQLLAVTSALELELLLGDRVSTGSSGKLVAVLAGLQRLGEVRPTPGALQRGRAGQWLHYPRSGSGDRDAAVGLRPLGDEVSEAAVVGILLRGDPW